MKKADVINHFNDDSGRYGTRNCAAALGVVPEAVTMWGAVVPVNKALMLDAITGGKLKFDKKFYQAELMKNQKGRDKVKK